VRPALVACAACLLASDFRPPAGERSAIRRPGAESILPGGRQITPYGLQYATGSAPFSMDMDQKGSTAMVANGRYGMVSLTSLRLGKGGRWTPERVRAPGAGPLAEELSGALVFTSDRHVLVSEGGSGLVRWLDTRSGKTRHVFDLGRGAYAAGLAYEATQQRFHVLDRANARLHTFDLRRRSLVSSVRLASEPVGLVVAGDRVYIAGQSSVEAIGGDARVELKPGLSAISSAAGRLFVSNSREDTVSVIDAETMRVENEIPIRIPELEGLRGVVPLGSLYHAETGRLLVAEAGINAVAVIDTKKLEVIGHVPVAWHPTALVRNRDWVLVSCRYGHGAGPNATRRGPEYGVGSEFHRGSVSIFALPDESELTELTKRVYANNGFFPQPQEPPALPGAIEHVVVIHKGDRTFDDVLGDVQWAGSRMVAGLPVLARYGARGIVRPMRGELQTRLSLRNINVTPNHHDMIRRWAFSDNFYGVPEMGIDWAAMRRHVEGHGRGFLLLREEIAASDQDRATRFIGRLEKGELPNLIVMELPNDRPLAPDPDSGFPFPASYVSDNDLALGRIIEYLSRSRWWGKMAVFVTAGGAPSGLDHIDSHRTILIAAGPHVRSNYVSHVNTGFAGLVKTVLRLLRVPPMGLADATAADLGDMFSLTADGEPYKALPVNPEIFNRY
jgi:YVTN family beta-propeller protein